MNHSNKIPKTSLFCALALAGALVLAPQAAKANVFASNIKIGGALTNGLAPVAQNGAVAISYILNEAATAGATITITSNATEICTITIASGSQGTLRGLNNVVWGTTNDSGASVPAGNYNFSIRVAANGFTTWTQTSSDTASGAQANYALGIDVDKNTNSIYYGRVVMGNATVGSNTNIATAAKKVGFYKMNADGSQADEGWYGNANYLADDGGDTPVAGQMPNSGGFDPMKIRIGDDDRIYWVDNSDVGAILACDMQATTNQIVISDGGSDGGHLGGPNNFSGCPDLADLGTIGFQVFDVAFTTTTNASIWLGCNNFPSWGVWMFHMTNGQSDPNDTQGSKVVETGGDLAIVSSGGVMVDNNLDIFVGQSRANDGANNEFLDAMVFTNWNGGVLPPDNSTFNFVMGASPGQVAWGYGSGVGIVTASNDFTMEAVEDQVIDSRQNPTMVAIPMGVGAQNGGGGIRLLNATNGSVITVTNGLGQVIQTLTNLDWHQGYTCAAWDAVGNLYAASTTRNVWRVYSPPGASANSTVALGTMAVQLLPASVSLTTTTFSGNAATNATPITATYGGSSPLTLQWYQTDTNGVTTPVVGQTTSTATTSTLALSNIQDSQNGDSYFLVASNAYGPAVTSTVAVLTVINPTASLATSTFSGNANGSATPITATAGGFSPTFQWYQVDSLNNTNSVIGQTNLTLALTSLSASQNGDKYFMVSSWTYAPSVATAAATLTVFNSPNITTNIAPPFEIVPTGTVQVFTVGATGALPLQFQWFDNGNLIPGATFPSYTNTAVNGSNTIYALVYNSVNPAGVASSNVTIVAPMTALSFSSTTGTNSNQGWDLNGGSTFSSPGVLQLTSGAASQARSAFYANSQLPINGFIANFTYQPSGSGTRADGITFCIQSAGPTRVGGGGGSLGVSGITNSVELEMNIYTGAGGGVGISLNTNGAIGPNSGGTNIVNINSGDPINVTIFYDPAVTNIFVKLVDSTTNGILTTNYTGATADILTVIGTNTAWVGFTGATGGSTATQVVSNFLFQSTSGVVLSRGALSGGNLPLSWNVGGMLLESSAVVGTNAAWSPVVSTVTTNFATGQAQTTVTPADPSTFYRLVSP